MTNSNLIIVFNGQLDNQTALLCNARDLHNFLQVQSDFNNWIKNRITDYGFVQGEDYIIVTERTAGRPHKEYHITLDMSKELGMVERNEKGRQIRKYFIACEKQAQQPQQLALPEPERTYTIALIARLPLEGELLDGATALLPKEDIVQVPLYIAEALVKFHRLTIKNAKKSETALRAIHESLGYERYIRNDLAAGLFDLHHEFNYWIYTLKEMGGWETLEMVKKYAHLNASHMVEYANRVTF
ncbi:hypothetical protein A1D23_13365 [Chelonobacter oris]|nr:hypothetical protein [Chelonobacter oris]